MGGIALPFRRGCVSHSLICHAEVFRPGLSLCPVSDRVVRAFLVLPDVLTGDTRSTERSRACAAEDSNKDERFLLNVAASIVCE